MEVVYGNENVKNALGDIIRSSGLKSRDELAIIRELRVHVDALRRDYDGLGEDREDALDDILKTIDKHLEKTTK